MENTFETTFAFSSNQGFMPTLSSKSESFPAFILLLCLSCKQDKWTINHLKVFSPYCSSKTSSHWGNSKWPAAVWPHAGTQSDEKGRDKGDVALCSETRKSSRASSLRSDWAQEQSHGLAWQRWQAEKMVISVCRTAENKMQSLSSSPIHEPVITGSQSQRPRARSISQNSKAGL